MPGLSTAVAGGVGYELWKYNRENFKFDREMRQKNELTILEFRMAQAKLWREDIRDIISLTEKKMDAYLVVAILQVDACVGLFTEGRLEPGSPPWLLHVYMMTLGAAFIYLLMSVWFAMHASVVAQSSSARILTQLVRLPVPTWGQVEDLRTYAASYERMNPKHCFRVPFTGRGSGSDDWAALSTASGAQGWSPSSPGWQAPTKESLEALTKPSGAFSAYTPENTAAFSPDPWGLEANGEQRQIYELTNEHPAMRRHVQLAREAAAQFRCYDAFARVAMTFGTNQFLCAIAYYSMGYLAVQDGAPWVSVSVAVTMGSMAAAMIAVDFSLTRCEQLSLQAPIAIALISALCSTFDSDMKEREVHDTVLQRITPYTLHAAYIANAFWLFMALRSCGIREEGGSRLPTKFRAVLYLDVFGWLQSGRDAEGGEASDGRPLLPLQTQQAQRCDLKVEGPSGQIAESPSEIFEPGTFGQPEDETEGIVTGRDRLRPGHTAAGVFTSLTWVLIALWVGGLALPLSAFHESLLQPLVGEHSIDELDPEVAETGISAEIAVDASGMPELVPKVGDAEDLPLLPGTFEPIKVAWLQGSTVIPRAIASDASGRRVVIADDFGLYIGEVQERRPASTTAPKPAPPAVPMAAEAAPSLRLGSPGASPPSAGGWWAPSGLLAPTPVQRPPAADPAPARETAEPLPLAWAPPLEPAFSREVTSTDIVPMSPPKAPEALAGRGAAVNAVALAAESGDHLGGSRWLRGLQARADNHPGAAGPGEDAGDGGELASEVPQHYVELRQVPLCPALRGQGLRDVSLDCRGDVCSVTALMWRGDRLVECRLPAGASASKNDAADAVVEISQEWLESDKNERVDSLALRPGCLARVAATQSRGNGAAQACAVVGTSTGRIVQMQESLATPDRLVPKQVVHQRPHPSSRGSLCMVRERYLLALWAIPGVLSAFDARDGSVVQEWRLPKGVEWRMIGSGGGDDFFLLGAIPGRPAELFRLRAPPELTGPDRQ